MSDQTKAVEHELVGPANEPNPVKTAGVSGSEVGDQVVAKLFQKVNEALLENRQKVDEALRENRCMSEALLEKVDAALHDIKETLKAEPEPVSISQVSSSMASRVLRQLKISIEDGHDVDPLEIDSTELPDFSMANFDGEEAATPSALKHIQTCLENHKVKFGTGGFKLHDMHQQKHLYELPIGGKMFRGGVDGVIVPYGIARFEPVCQLRAAIELKYSEKHRALYLEKAQGIPLPRNLQETKFSGTVRGQALLEALAGLVETEHPEIMLLVTDIDFNTLIKYESGTFIIWENISFNQAIQKLAKFLNNCNADRKYRLEQAMCSMSKAATAALEPTVQLRKKLKPNNPLLLEQLESALDPDMSVNESLATAMQLIHAHRPSSDSWEFMFG